MKVLFICNAIAYNETNRKSEVQVAPWVQALAEVLAQEKDIELALAFQCHNAKLAYYKTSDMHYYPISTELDTVVKKWWYKFTEAIHIPNESKKFNFILTDFCPDIICVFGTEFSFGNIVKYTKVPVVVHIQSLVTAYLNYWYSPTVTEKLVKRNCSKWSYLKGAGVLHAYNRFVKQGQREREFFNTIKYYMGRTTWDKNELLERATQATYFHVDEIMRPVFYNKHFEVRKKASKVLTAINPNIYKGIDFIFEICREIEQKHHDTIEWRIAGVNQNDEVVRIAAAAAAFLPSTIKPKFIGACSATQLADEMAAADCYVHVSSIENSSNSICEAMLIGLPVIALATGGTVDIIEHLETGILVQTRNAAEFSDVLVAQLQNYESRIQLSNKAKRKAEQRHNRAQIANRIVEVFTQISRNNAN